MFRKFYIVFCLAACWWMMACTSSVQREAQETVAQADSLWRAGEAYTDSVALAKAYETLSSSRYQLLSIFNKPLATDYAHVCYHYGKLLRAKENPAAAMECFINATHSRTRDHHILGRVYSNMGDICHLAGEYALSYDMFEQSADMFLKNGDSLLYYYGLNEMAFELAEQGDKTHSMRLLDSIRLHPDQFLHIKALETEAMLLQKSHKDDSVITIIDSLQMLGYHDVLGYIMKARAYGHKDIRDSAVWYAQKVIELSTNGNGAIPAYYIMAHLDNTISIDSVLSIASMRADAQKEWGLQRGKLTQAVLLLEQDIHHLPNRRWLLAVCLTIIIIGICLWVYVHKKRKQHKLLAQQVDELEQMNDAAKQHHTQIMQEHSIYKNNVILEIEKACDIFNKSPHLQKDLCWSNYDQMCDIANRHLFFFVHKLQKFHSLSEKEVRLCVLVLIGISDSKQLAEMLYYAPSGIRNFKSHTAKKLGTNSIEMRKILLNIATGESINFDTR